jgi:uncharacterized protein YdbL (DUF1318 family)
MSMRLPALLLFAGAIAAPGAVRAQGSPALAAAQRAGAVGERFDGYLGIASDVPAALRREVAAINIRRRSLYIGLASRRRVTAEVAAIATGCELLGRIAVGGSYMLRDGVWRRRAAGQPAPSPDYCG